MVHLKKFLSHSTDSLRRLKVLRSELGKHLIVGVVCEVIVFPCYYRKGERE